jgi:hypothetical protein
VAGEENVGGLVVTFRVEPDATSVEDLHAKLEGLAEDREAKVSVSLTGADAAKTKIEQLERSASRKGGATSGARSETAESRLVAAFSKLSASLSNFKIAIDPDSISAIGKAIRDAVRGIDGDMAPASGAPQTSQYERTTKRSIQFGPAPDIGRPAEKKDAPGMPGGWTVRNGAEAQLTAWRNPGYIQRQVAVANAIGRQVGRSQMSWEGPSASYRPGAERGGRPVGDPDTLQGKIDNAATTEDLRRRSLGGRVHRGPPADALTDVDAVWAKLRDIAGNPNVPRVPRVRALFRALRKPDGEDILRGVTAPEGPWEWYKGVRAAGFSSAGVSSAAAPGSQPAVRTAPDPTVTCPDCGQPGIMVKGLASHKRQSPRHKPVSGTAAAQPNPTVTIESLLEKAAVARSAARPVVTPVATNWQRQERVDEQANQEVGELTGEYLIHADPKGRKTGRYHPPMAEETYRGIKVFKASDIRGRSGRGRQTAASYDPKAHRITIDEDMIRGQFEAKGWRDMAELEDKTRAEPLPDELFPTLASYRQFVLEHEYRHSQLAPIEGETRGEYEDLINNVALLNGPVESKPTGGGSIQARLMQETRHQARVGGARHSIAQALRPGLQAEAHQLAQSYVESGGTLDYKAPNVPRRVAGTGKEYQGAEKAPLEFPAVLRGSGELARTFRRVLEESRTGEIGPAYRLLTPEAVAGRVPGPEPIEKKTAKLRLLRMPIKGPGSELLQALLGPSFDQRSKFVSPTVPSGPLGGQGLFRVSTAERIKEELVTRLGLESADELTSNKNQELRSLYYQFEKFRLSLAPPKQRLATQGMAVWQRGPTFARNEMPFEATVYNRQGEPLRTARFHKDRMRAGGARAGRERDARAWNRHKVREGILSNGGRLGRLDLTGRGLDMSDLTGADAAYVDKIRERVGQGDELSFADEAINKSLNMLALYKLGPVGKRKREEDKLLPEVSRTDLSEFLYGRHSRVGETEEEFTKRGGFQAGLMDVLGKPSQLVQRATGILGGRYGVGSKDRRRLTPVASTLLRAISGDARTDAEFRAKAEADRQGREERNAGLVGPRAPSKYTGLGIQAVDANLYSIKQHEGADRLQRAQDVLILKRVEASNRAAMAEAIWTPQGADLSEEAPGRGPKIQQAFRPAPGYTDARGLPTDKAHAKSGKRGRAVGELISQGLTEEERARSTAEDEAEFYEALAAVATPTEEGKFRSLPGGIAQQRRVTAETAIAQRKLLALRAARLPTQGRTALRQRLAVHRKLVRINQAVANTWAPITKPSAKPVAKNVAQVQEDLDQAAGTPPPEEPAVTTTIAPEEPVAAAGGGAPPSGTRRRRTRAGAAPESTPSTVEATAATSAATSTTPPMGGGGVVKVDIVKSIALTITNPTAARAERAAGKASGATAGAGRAKGKTDEERWSQPGARESLRQVPNEQTVGERLGTRGRRGARESLVRVPDEQTIGERMGTRGRRGASDRLWRMPSLEQITSRLHPETVVRERAAKAEAAEARRFAALPFDERVNKKAQAYLRTLPAGGEGTPYYATSTAAGPIRPFGGRSPEDTARQMALREELAPLGLRPNEIEDRVWIDKARALAAEHAPGTREPWRLSQVRGTIRREFKQRVIAKGVKGEWGPRDEDTFFSRIFTDAGIPDVPTTREPSAPRTRMAARSMGPDKQLANTMRRLGITPAPVDEGSALRGLEYPDEETGEQLDPYEFLRRNVATAQTKRSLLSSRALSSMGVQYIGRKFGPWGKIHQREVELTAATKGAREEVGAYKTLRGEFEAQAPIVIGRRTAARSPGATAEDKAGYVELRSKFLALGKATHEQAKVANEAVLAQAKLSEETLSTSDTIQHLGASFAGGVAGAVVGSLAGQIAAPILQSIVQGFSATIGPQVEMMLGYSPTRARVMSELSGATAQQGGIASQAFASQYAFTPTVATAGMEPVVAQAEAITANKQFEKYRDVFRTNAGMQKGIAGNEAALSWSQGPLGGPLGGLLADFKSTAELIGSNFSSPMWGRSAEDETKNSAWVERVNALADYGAGGKSEYRLAPIPKIELWGQTHDREEGMSKANLGAVSISGYAVVDSFGNVVTSADELTKYLKNTELAFTRMSPERFVGQQKAQIAAQIGGMQAQRQFALDFTNPVQRYMDYITNVPLAPGTGVLPGMNAKANKAYPAMGYDLEKGMVPLDPEVAGSYGDLTSSIKLSQEALAATAAKGRKALEDWEVPTEAIDQIEKYGQSIRDIQEEIGGIQSNLNWTQHERDATLAKRAVTDLTQLTGKLGKTNGDNVGYYERQLLLINRASTALSLQLQERQITTQEAVAGFAVQGDTPEIRMARRKEAELEASIARKQLGYSKQAFGVEIKLVDATNLRNLQDAIFSYQALQRTFHGGITIGLKQQDIENMQKVMASLVPDASTWISYFAGYEQYMIGLGVQLASITEKTVKEMVGGIRKELNSLFPGMFPEPAQTESTGPSRSLDRNTPDSGVLTRSGEPSVRLTAVPEPSVRLTAVPEPSGMSQQAQDAWGARYAGYATTPTGDAGDYPSNVRIVAGKAVMAPSAGGYTPATSAGTSIVNNNNQKYENSAAPVFNVNVSQLSQEAIADLTTKVVQSINSVLAQVGLRPVAR